MWVPDLLRKACPLPKSLRKQGSFDCDRAVQTRGQLVAVSTTWTRLQALAVQAGSEFSSSFPRPPELIHALRRIAQLVSLARGEALVMQA